MWKRLRPPSPTFVATAGLAGAGKAGAGRNNVLYKQKKSNNDDIADSRKNRARNIKKDYKIIHKHLHFNTYMLF